MPVDRRSNSTLSSMDTKHGSISYGRTTPLSPAGAVELSEKGRKGSESLDKETAEGSGETKVVVKVAEVGEVSKLGDKAELSSNVSKGDETFPSTGYVTEAEVGYHESYCVFLMASFMHAVTHYAVSRLTSVDGYYSSCECCSGGMRRRNLLRSDKDPCGI